MSFLINPYSFGSTPPPSAPDFSGLNITRMFGVFKTSLTTIDYPFEITRNTGDTTTYRVHWDSNNKISGDSPIYEGDTDTGDTLSDLASDFPTWDVVVLYCHITGIALDDGALATRRGNCHLIESNTINALNGECAMKFDAEEGLVYGLSISELDNGNSFTVYAVGNSENATKQGTFLSNSTNSATSNDSRFIGYFDRRTQKRAGILVNTSGTLQTADLTAQNNSNAQRRIAITVDGSDIISYQNNTLQSTTSITGSWVNDNLRVGTQRNDEGELEGHIQCIIVCDSALNSTDLSDLDGRVDAILNF